MKNAAGTENRFPYTVMDAVYGLNSYLQDQFSALADIYMPIEGITESKTGQEFVYRKSPATIKAKSLTLDRIYGKTLAWNQLVQNGNFAYGTNGWASKESASIAVANNELSVTITTTPAVNYAGYVACANIDRISQHKYLILVDAFVPHAGTFVIDPDSGMSGTITVNVVAGQWNSCIVLLTATQSISKPFYFYPKEFTDGYAQGDIYKIRNVNCIDLTLLYGSEIDGLTDEQILAKFESEFPGYHDFGNKLISNDAESIETTGFNKWDEEWESGGLDTTTGAERADTSFFRSTFIRLIPGKAYYYKAPASTLYARHYFYDENKQFIAGSYYGSSIYLNALIGNPENAAYMRFTILKAAYGTTYNHDICINLSVPAKNGTYEPYRKTTLQLGLNNFKVKSHNIWDEQWELGAYNYTNGEKVNDSGMYRSKNLIPVLQNTTYYWRQPNVQYKRICFYDANRNFISYLNGNANTEFTTPTGCAFISIWQSGTTYNNDICINLSSSFNGQYEPHGDIAITGGLKGDGSWADILYSNNHLTNKAKRVNLGDLNWEKYTNDVTGKISFYATVEGIQQCDVGVAGNLLCPKYVTQPAYYVYTGLSWDKCIGVHSSYPFIYIADSAYSDAATFKAAMDGVYLDYELATPIEYELVEPLVYSMAAGTTEARVSPNSDGLSAPFCCDMTYDANANNDSANAQYAATAGRLYNTHKLWGQDFDGSNDVSGALSGVSTIGASGNITTAAQLISTVATGTAPLSVESTTEVANLHSYTATKIHTQRTLWGQNFDGSGNVTGDMSSVGNIAFSASGKNIASLLYFDTTNSRVGVGASSPAYKLDVNGTLNASGNTTLGGTLGVTGNTTIGGTFTVGTSSVNKETTLYGALTASGAVSFSDTLTIAGLTTFNGNAILPANKTFTIGPSSGTHATLEWDATNSCVKITGNLRVTGWIEQQGTQS